MPDRSTNGEVTRSGREANTLRAEFLARQLGTAHTPVAGEVAALAEFAFSHQNKADHATARLWSNPERLRALHDRLIATATPHVRQRGFVRILVAIRNVLVLAPIALTWYGLGIAAEVYPTCDVDKGKLEQELKDRRAGQVVETDVRNALVRIPFLKLWENGFEGDDIRCDTSVLAKADGLGLRLNRFSQVVYADLKMLLVIAGISVSLSLANGSLDRRRHWWLERIVPELDWVFLCASLRADAILRPRSQTDTRARARAGRQPATQAAPNGPSKTDKPSANLPTQRPDEPPPVAPI